MFCVNTPLVTFQTINRNDNLTLEFRSRRQTIVETAIRVILFEIACLVCCFVLEVTLLAHSVTNTQVSIVLTLCIKERKHCT
jgi:hypothetical protein